MDTFAQNSASSQPFGSYAAWARSTAIFTGIVASIGAIVGGRGDVAGTIVTILFNPIAWLAIWFWLKSTRIVCPHCGTSNALTIDLHSKPTGATTRCCSCQKEYRKPAMNGKAMNANQSVHFQNVSLQSTQSVNPRKSSPSAAGAAAGKVVLIIEPNAETAEADQTDTSANESLPTLTTQRLNRSEPPRQQPVAEAGEEIDPVILRVDGTSSFLTLKEHQRRGWKESARCDLSNRNLRGYSFAGANLEGAKLDGSDFSGCSFKAANLTDASARNCNFEGVDFTSARLRRADLSYCVLRKSIFCSLDGIFMAATIDCTNFAFCDLSDVRFVLTPPGSPTEFLSCRLKAADFSSSNLSRSNLRGIDFRTCRFMGANLFGTSLQRCNFEGVDLGSTNLVNANLAQVIFSDSSKFPNGFVLPPSTRNMDIIRRAEQRAAQDLVRLIGKLLIALTVVVMVAVIWRLPDWQHKAVSTPKSKSVTSSSDLLPPADSVSVEDKPATAEPSTSTEEVVQQPIRELGRPKPIAQRPIEKANELYFSSRYAEAIEAYEHLITLNEKDPTPKMNLARLLATCPLDRFRDGQRALSLALDAQRNSEVCWKVMSIIAAAHAEVGDFRTAKLWADNAKNVPDSDQATIDRMLEHFRQRLPCRW